MALKEITQNSNAITWMETHLCRNNRFLGLLCKQPWANGRVFCFFDSDIELAETKHLSLDQNILLDSGADNTTNIEDSQRATESFVLSFLQSSHRAAAIFGGVVHHNPSLRRPFVQDGGEAFAIGPLRTQYWNGTFRESVHNFLFVNGSEASLEKVAFCLREANVWPKVCVLVLLPEDVSQLVHGMTATSEQLAHLISDLRYVVFDAFDFTQYAVWCAPGMGISDAGHAELGRQQLAERNS